MTQLRDPVTLTGKDLLIQKEIRQGYDDYFELAVRKRAWFPHKLAVRTQLKKWSRLSHLLDPKVKKILVGFLAVESFVDDYVYAGIQGAGNEATTREMVYQWGMEEKRHGDMFRIILIDSELMTQLEVDGFLAECSKDTWVFERQTGGQAATTVNATAYGSTQERQTGHNYTSFRKYLRAEFDRTKNPLLLAIDEAVGYIERDEVAHGNRFIDIWRVYFHYRPEMAIDAMFKALEHYTMPVVDFPNKQEFAEAIVAAGVFSFVQGFGKEVLKPILKRVGLEKRSALKNAIKNVQNLPENAIIQIQHKAYLPMAGDFVLYKMTEQGEFVQLVA